MILEYVQCSLVERSSNNIDTGDDSEAQVTELHHQLENHTYVPKETTHQRTAKEESRGHAVTRPETIC